MFRILLLMLIFAGPVAAETLTVDEVWVRPGSPLDRQAVEIDAVERARVLGTLEVPSAAPPSGARGWIPVQADAEGWIVDDGLRRGHALARIEVSEDSTWILDGMGYAHVVVDDEPRVGNVYGYKDSWETWEPSFDFSRIPLRLKAGTHWFLFSGSRYGLMRARLERVESGLSLNLNDVTLPDLVVGRPSSGLAAIVVLNATDDVVSDALIEARVAGGEVVRTPLPPLPPMGVRKVGFAFDAVAPSRTEQVPLVVRLLRSDAPADVDSLHLQVKDPFENRRVTFRSEIDGSVQYFGYLPASESEGEKALFLSLHGAAVEAINQSGSYASRSWGHLVAPTNRRPFGLSWENWGRRDALEVLDLAERWLGTDPDRVYLTGHSMGGHGSWHLSTLLPERFAAVGPSAGWISIWSYRQDPPRPSEDPVVAMVERGTLPSRTLEFVPNLDDLGLYVLHGSADDNVPPDQAHLILESLEPRHRDLVYHEEPDVGHWWDLSDDAGADCVNWPPMFDFFARHRRPSDEEVEHVQFRTPSPDVSHRYRWARVARQRRPFAISSIDLDRDTEWTRLRGTTENVEVLALDWGGASTDTIDVEVDGQALRVPIPADRIVWLERDDRWRVAVEPPRRWKGPANNGGFRSAWEHRVQLVYGTQGTEEENRWALAKARYDAEWLWYQANASVDVLPDTLFDPAAEPDRSVVLYGHSAMHEDWNALVDDVVAVEAGSVNIGPERFEGDEFGMLAVRPRPGSARASVGIVAATGTVGRRLMDRRPFLALGVAYPDVTVFACEEEGSVVVGAGYFGNDWSIDRGEFVWRPER